MTDLQRNILSVALEGFDKSAPSQEQLDETLIYSQEGWKGALAGFLTYVGATGVGAVGGLMVAGPVGAFIGAAMTAGGARAATAAKMLRLKNDINVVAKRIKDLQGKAVEKAKAEGIKVESKYLDYDIALIISNGVFGGIAAAMGGFLHFVGLGSQMAFQHQAEELQKEFDKKLMQLKVELTKAGYKGDLGLD